MSSASHTLGEVPSVLEGLQLQVISNIAQSTAFTISQQPMRQESFTIGESGEIYLVFIPKSPPNGSSGMVTIRIQLVADLIPDGNGWEGDLGEEARGFLEGLLGEREDGEQLREVSSSYAHIPAIAGRLFTFRYFPITRLVWVVDGKCVVFSQEQDEG